MDVRIEGQIDTQWKYTVKVTAAFPKNNAKGYKVNSVVVESGQKTFWIDEHKNCGNYNIRN